MIRIDIVSDELLDPVHLVHVHGPGGHAGLMMKPDLSIETPAVAPCRTRPLYCSKLISLYPAHGPSQKAMAGGTKIVHMAHMAAAYGGTCPF